MPATLTKERVRTRVAMRVAEPLRSGGCVVRTQRPSGQADTELRFRVTPDGMLVGRLVLSLPCDVS